MPEEINATVKDLVSLYGSYEALARELGVSWVTVQRWIKGQTRPIAFGSETYPRACQTE